MPHLGVSVFEGTLNMWLKQIGDSVAVGEPICEISTDKVDTEIESTVSGVVAAHLYAEGDTVPVGQPLARVVSQDEWSSLDGAPAPPPSETQSATPAVASPPPAASAEPPKVQAAETHDEAARPAVVESASSSAHPSTARFDHRARIAEMLERGSGQGRSAVSPAARQRAAESGIDVSSVPGSGGNGRVTLADVDNARLATAGIAESAIPEPTGAELPLGYEDVPHVVSTTSRIRQVTAEHMTRSRRTSAHMTTEVDVDLGALTDVRAEINRQRHARGASKVSYLPFIARALCTALRHHPELNATFQGERVVLWGEVNLGIAVDTPRGLMVPVVRRADALGVGLLADAVSAAAQRVRAGEATPDDFRAGTFTLSNPGSVGAVSAPAIINQPQVGILGMPTIVRRPWVIRLPDGQEAIAIRPIIRLALTFDHRAVDGADATRCLAAIATYLESWRATDYR